MSETLHSWKYLERRPGSSYQQLCIKGKRIWAWTLYCEFMNEKVDLHDLVVSAAKGHHGGVLVVRYWQ
jgi:hypothetical protein